MSRRFYGRSDVMQFRARRTCACKFTTYLGHGGKSAGKRGLECGACVHLVHFAVRFTSGDSESITESGTVKF